MDSKDIPALLLFISRVNEGEKIVTTNCSINDSDNLWDKFKRTVIYSENRHKTLRWITDIIDQALERYDQLMLDTEVPFKNSENGKLAENLLANIEKSKEGIRNMKKTYADDTYHCARLDELLNNIDIKINIRQK